ncbi:TetR family transcriptional regulator [Sphingomonas sp. DBB INV C78]|uniref:TetR/AcrR family transcriptional regulator n=1 Tax=Sphingomonas sp. DBB INV C78 TaxID=3349434 RepID=UPI0036D36F7D
MSRKRLSSGDRRDSIIAAATSVFAQQGFSGARTNDIAKTAKVSEALLFRHFPSKVAIYRAVLRRIIRTQDETYSVLSGMTPDAAGMIDILRRTFRNSLNGLNAPNAEGIRLYVSSMGGDSSYASLAYRRSLRLWLKPLEHAMEQARAAGDLVGAPIPARNAFAFIEHISTMMLISRTHKNGTISYEGTDEALLEDAIRFCARGLGMTEAALEAHAHLMRKAGTTGAIEAGKGTTASSKVPKAKPRKARAKAA